MEVFIKKSTETNTELTILKRIKYPKNYIFGVYLHDQRNSTVALFSNKGSKPIRVQPLKNEEHIDRKFGYFELGKSSTLPKLSLIHI